jgi:uncharacterized protein
MIPRLYSKKLLELAAAFKALAVIGPRQSGKTTLVKSLFSKKPYVNLENPDNRSFAIDDPRGFLSQYPSGAILDEIQRAPALFSYLQEILDSNRKPGQFIMTGSNNFLLQENISQSLAGRMAYLNLLPFSLGEIKSLLPKMQLNDLLLKGFYPPLYDSKISAVDWYPNYFRTYIERDVRQIKNITDLLVFERFMRLLAGRNAQEMNYRSLSIESGVDIKTVQSWIGILESSFIVFLLKPHLRNFNKTIVKRPKLYFYDTGLVCFLLGIRSEELLQTHPLRGALFECFIVSELIKKCSHKGNEINLSYWRDKSGIEIDIIIDNDGCLFPLEIKAGRTIHSDFFKNLQYYMKLGGIDKGGLIYTGDSGQKRSSGIEVISWRRLAVKDALKFNGTK